jgi:ATP-dependent DNA helicase RecQ
MNEFINSETCREVYLRNYFGDTENQPCGHCDNCLKSNKRNAGNKLDSKLVKDTLALLSKQDLSLKMISNELNINYEEAKAVLSFLIKENKIKVSQKDSSFYSLSSFS